MTTVSVATWNLHQAVDRRPDNIARTWAYLRDELRPTVALVQEAMGRSIPNEPGRSLYWPAGEVQYETAVVAYEGRLERLGEITTRYSTRAKFAIRPTVPATLAIARVVDVADVEPFIAISMYGRMAPLYAQTGVLRAVADILPLFDSAPHNRRVVMGGDLNAFDQTSDRVMRERWKAIQTLIESLGLVNLLKHTQADRGPAPGCPCKADDCWHVETFPPATTRRQARLLHVRLPLRDAGKMTTRLTGLEVCGSRTGIWELSDHCPLVARFEL